MLFFNHWFFFCVPKRPPASPNSLTPPHFPAWSSPKVKRNQYKVKLVSHKIQKKINSKWAQNNVCVAWPLTDNIKNQPFTFFLVKIGSSKTELTWINIFYNIFACLFKLSLNSTWSGIAALSSPALYAMTSGLNSFKASGMCLEQRIKGVWLFMKSSICYKSALPHIFRQTFIPLQLPLLHVLEKRK